MHHFCYELSRTREREVGLGRTNKQKMYSEMQSFMLEHKYEYLK